MKKIIMIIIIPLLVLSSPVFGDESKLTEVTDERQSFLDRLRNKKEELTPEKFCKKFNNTIIEFINAVEITEASINRLKEVKKLAFVKVLVNASYNDIDGVYIDLYGLKTNDKELENLRDYTLAIVIDTGYSCRKAKEALENMSGPDLGTLFSSVNRMARKANEIFDESFVEKYVKIIEEKAPLIREDIMYKMKDIHKKSNEKVDSDEEQMGKLGVTLFAARKEPQILEIKKDGAAEKEDLEVFDKILGVEGGTVFESQKYFYDFIDTTSPGDRVVFIIERNSEEMKKRIELQ